MPSSIPAADDAPRSAEDRAEFGKRLAQARKAADLLQPQAGQCIGVPKDTISRWERGQNDPSFLAVARLAELYGVSLDWLSGSSSHESGLQLGHTIVDLQALEFLRNAKRTGKRLVDLRDYISGPTYNCAWDIPDDLVVINQKHAKKLHYELQTLLDALDKRDRKMKQSREKGS